MKILKIFGIVVGIHVFALVLIFANPGCSSTTQAPPSPSDTVARADAPPLTVPMPPASSSSMSGGGSAVTFNPDAPATAAPSSGPRAVPTRPNTPVASVLVAEPVVDVTPATTYVVKSGDSLWTIAKKNHLATAELAAANSLSVNAKIQPNQKLIIPGKPAAPNAAATAKGGAGPTSKAVEVAPAAASRNSGDAMKHVVKKGETLEKIARLYGVKQGDIAVANNISDPAKIKENMELIIPGWQPTTKSGKAGKSGASSSAKVPASEPKVDPAPPTQSVPLIPIIPLDNPITPAPRP